MRIEDLKLPRPVRFKYPAGETLEKIVKGQILDEVRLRVGGTVSSGEYLDVIQYIKLDNGKEIIRFGYYKLKSGAKEDEWRWGSQTTLWDEIPNLKELFAIALTKSWFKDLITPY
ncbi:MAG: hypothetical protein MUO82_00255 [Candidatus Thermoplasmatota archaeon]|nr:hypothetical protein [Candidatus Thermoplasmatota archaeon]